MGTSRLPVQQPTGDTPTTRDFMLLQSGLKGVIDPVISNPSNQALLLKGVALKNGVTVVNHLLGRTPQGWRIADINGSAQIYRSAALDPQTLTLTSNAAVTVNLEVF